MTNTIIHGDCLEVLRLLPENHFRLAYIDPPFNTLRTQRRQRIRTVADEEGDRTGFGGKTYRTEHLSSAFYEDNREDYIPWLMERIELAWSRLTPDGSLFVHLDENESHYVKVALDKLLGRHRFKQEIIWNWDYGARSKTMWPRKHNTIFWYAKDPDNYVFNFDAMDRLPYLAPDLVGPEKAARGKTPTSCWTMTIVPTNSKEKTSYPTQKPLHLLRRILKVHSCEGDYVLDFFAGSGSTGHAAHELGRFFTMVDENPEAIKTMEARYAKFNIPYTKGTGNG